MDGGEVETDNSGRLSPYQRLKGKVSKGIQKLGDEFQEELNDNKKHVQNAEDVAHDLVEPETFERLRNMVFETPHIEEGIDWKLWYHIIRKSITYVIMKFVDIITDFLAAYQHFKRGDINYGCLTLFFVYLPGKSQTYILLTHYTIFIPKVLYCLLGSHIGVLPTEPQGILQ